MGLKKKSTNVSTEQKAQQTEEAIVQADNAPVEEEKVIESTAEILNEEPVADEPVEEEKVVEEPAEVKTKAEIKTTKKQVPAETKKQTTSTAVSTETKSVTDGAGSALAQAAQEGFEGLEVGFGTFPTAVIGTGGSFEVDGEDEDFQTFTGRLETSKALYLCTQDGVQDSPSAFTYDGKNLNSPESGCTTVDDLRRAWAEEGETLVIRKYLEVVVEIQSIDGNDDPESHDFIGQFIICKIPPSSLNKFSGIVMMASRRGIPINELLVEFGMGKRRESRSGNKYTPWAFKQVK